MNSLKCIECGFVGWADAEFCKRCGAALSSQGSSHTYQSPPVYGNEQHVEWTRSNRELKTGLAIASLVLGIVSFFCVGGLIVGPILGLTLAIVALVKSNRYPFEYGGKGLATAGLVMNILSLVIAVPIMAAIAIPNLLASRRAANEASSIYTLRKINAAEATYKDRHGTFGTLDELEQEQLIERDIALGKRHGYQFTVTDRISGFEAMGTPDSYPSSGRRSFYVNETGVIRAADRSGADATRSDAPLDSDNDYYSGPTNSRPNKSSSGY
jgi:type IV pilus assembly protein PilA